MKFEILSTILATTSLASAATYKITNLSQTKTGDTLTNISFHLQATNGGTFDLACSSTAPFKPSYRYSCSGSENFTFEFLPTGGTHGNTLTIWQKVGGEWKKGETGFDDLPCWKGAGGQDSKVCQWQKDRGDITVDVDGA